jgi:hypothetical protein
MLQGLIMKLVGTLCFDTDIHPFISMHDGKLHESGIFKQILCSSRLNHPTEIHDWTILREFLIQICWSWTEQQNILRQYERSMNVFWARITKWRSKRASFCWDIWNWCQHVKGEESLVQNCSLRFARRNTSWACGVGLETRNGARKGSAVAQKTEIYCAHTRFLSSCCIAH